MERELDHLRSGERERFSARSRASSSSIVGGRKADSTMREFFEVDEIEGAWMCATVIGWRDPG